MAMVNFIVLLCSYLLAGYGAHLSTVSLDEKKRIRAQVTIWFLVFICITWTGIQQYLYYLEEPHYPQIWKIIEGQQHEFTGTWEIPEVGRQFRCTFESKTAVIPYHEAQCIVTESRGYVTVDRFFSTMNVNCIYWGEREGKTIRGHYFCNRESKSAYPLEWSVDVQ